MLLVFDWGGSAVKYGLWDGAQLSHQQQFKTPSTFAALKEKMQAIQEEFATYGLTGVSISAPGAVDVPARRILGISAIPYIHNFDIFTELEELFQLPLTIENDANCAGLAEVYQGVAKDKKEVLFVVVGSGVGGAVFHEGRLLKGAHLFGGEFGLMLLDGVHSLSNLGTAVAMANRYCDVQQVPRDTYSGKDVFALAEKGDVAAKLEVENFYNYLAQGLYNLQFTLDPEMIVIGGGVSALPGLAEELEKRVLSYLAKFGVKDFTPQVVPCQFRNDANLIGAAVNFQLNDLQEK